MDLDGFDKAGGNVTVDLDLIGNSGDISESAHRAKSMPLGSPPWWPSYLFLQTTRSVGVVSSLSGQHAA